MLAGLKAAVIPAGSPETDNITLLMKLLVPTIVIVELVPIPPACKETAFNDEVRLKLGTGIVSWKVVTLLNVPDVPVIVTV